MRAPGTQRCGVRLLQMNGMVGARSETCHGPWGYNERPVVEAPVPAEVPRSSLRPIRRRRGRGWSTGLALS